MSKDIHIRIIKRDRFTNTWQQVKLYHKEKGKFKLVDVYSGRDYELFNILEDHEGALHFYPLVSFSHLPQSLYQEIKEWQNEGGYNFREISLAELKLYLYNVPYITDWESEEVQKDNPVKGFINIIEQYVNFADPFYNCIAPSDIRICYWFDW